MCIDFCKKYKNKIEELQNVIEEYTDVINNCYKNSEEKDKTIEELRGKYEQAKLLERPGYCRPNQCPFRNGNQSKKKLEISGNRILYGGQVKRLCGVSRWEALWRATGEYESWGDYSQSWYEEQLINSGINYVRHGGVKNTQFLYDHCKRMKDAGIIVEITVYRAHCKSKGVLVHLDEMKDVADLGNVFFDINNEFLDCPENVDTAIGIATKLKEQKCLISGGAWSGVSGMEQSDNFHSRCDIIDIISHHRNWNASSFGQDMRFGKPVVWNEYFAFKENLSLQQVKALMNTAFDCGYAGVQYYGFRNSSIFPGLENDDPFYWKDILDYAGSLAQ